MGRVFLVLRALTIFNDLVDSPLDPFFAPSWAANIPSKVQLFTWYDSATSFLELEYSQEIWHAKNRDCP